MCIKNKYFYVTTNHMCFKVLNTFDVNHQKMIWIKHNNLTFKNTQGVALHCHLHPNKYCEQCNRKRALTKEGQLKTNFGCESIRKFNRLIKDGMIKPMPKLKGEMLL